ncbi:NAD(P)(+) transhydrogenase (Re/Si-specific) subunit beta [Gracilimonas sp.]|uniref:NAD(P)(+) transhydrogenase (Re/Si-specific) subunit beta n=1 Tax=Gracilimonas sp. TaxID=1974203 RepID=UPI0032EC97CD
MLQINFEFTSFVHKKSLSQGIDNPLFYDENNQMFFGDAKKSLQALNEALNDV